MNTHSDVSFRRGCLSLIGVVVTMIALCFVAFCATAQGSERVEKMALLTAYAVIDYRQSCEAFYTTDGYFPYGPELNPILGKTPTRRDMIVFGAAGISVLAVALYVLPESWGDVLLDSALTTQGANIEANQTILQDMNIRRTALPIMLTWRF